MTSMQNIQPLSESGQSIAYLEIGTGHTDCRARFYPALYRLDLIRADGEEKIDLGFSGSRLLERLLQTPGQVVPRDALLSHAWSDRIVGPGSLNQQIYTLRQVLGDEKRREIIQTLPRRGYLFNPKFLASPPLTAERQPDAPTTEATETVTPSPPFAASLEHFSRPLASWRLSLRTVGIGGVLALMLLMVLSGFYTTMFQTRVFSTEVQAGKAQIIYADTREKALQELVMDTHSLSQQVAELATRPAKLVLNLTADFYEILCVQPNGGVNWLMVHNSQLAAIPNENLKSCLN
ncbi:winged helix-turn-helix domain-containing protein [Pseudomonas sp. Q1-7]|uniref:winged helix-turn-helix domain-containing protein n=1 Tax=Pseudomonas sp. Q1-7 TaxID=3020843 RepID=UPI002301F36E|nr:winged helix-turn-helix domain-containing protein [Pseudomonas sp. Q1-7]